MQKYDYIITGTGATGLMLAYQMGSDPFFNDKKLLLIDKEIKNQNDRTWCFWEKGKGDWEAIIYKRWNHIFFGSDDYSKQISIAPYWYKMLRGKDFYDYVLKEISGKPNITIVHEMVTLLTDLKTEVTVETNKNSYAAAKVFNSIVLSENYKEQNKYPVLNQHFLGWFVKTKEDVFDDSKATFMDFTVAQYGNTRFMYVLPSSKKEALFEYTLFSEDLLPEKEYEDEIIKYLKEKEITQYEIVEKEKGCIPMTCYDFKNSNSKNILHIGTAGGWTKPSTGFTFQISSKKIKELIPYIKANKDLSKFEKKTRFWFYDLLFLDVLYKDNAIGSILFSRLFRKNDPVKILKFLDNETSFTEEIKITTSLPWGKFLKALFNRIF